jgi:hypothetical protein
MKVRFRFAAILGFFVAFGNIALPAHSGVPRCASSSQTPLTVSDLRRRATLKGLINDSQSTLTKNRRMGRAFQDFVGRSMRLTGRILRLLKLPDDAQLMALLLSAQIF